MRFTVQFNLHICVFVLAEIALVSSRANCPALRSESVDFKCRYQGKTVSCESEIVPWTKATLACKNFYRIPLATDLGYREITCLEDGVWNRAVFNCTLDCGTALDESTPLIVNGSPVKREGSPWRVFIYKKLSSGVFAPRYQGTLISPSLVITNAWWMDGENGGRSVNASKYAVAVGKFSYYYNIPEPYAQRSLISYIEVSEGFNSTYLIRDIALLHLESPFTLTILVRPICINWENMFENRKREKDVATWVKTASAAIPLPYTPYEECLSRVIEADKPYLGADNFCTGCQKRSSSCDYIGHGYAFGCEFNGIWYLLGIQSTALSSRDSSCDGIDMFTKIEPYLEWIYAALISSE